MQRPGAAPTLAARLRPIVGAGWLLLTGLLAAQPTPPALDLSDLAALRQKAGQPMNPDQFIPLLAGSAPVAFEDNAVFTYAMGRPDNPATGPWQRRVLFLKPLGFAVEDRLHVPAASVPVIWQLCSDQPCTISQQQAVVPTPGGEFICETLLPPGAVLRSTPGPNASEDRPRSVLTVTPQEPGREMTFLHVLRFQVAGRADLASLQLSREPDFWRLTIPQANRLVRWEIPFASDDPPHFESLRAGGNAVVPRRLLPSGILPFGEEGRRMLETWDSTYRRSGPAPWDTGRPSSELKRLVESGLVQSGRVLELGCGSGLNAIYLAQQGFEVSALDIAPTGLARAEAAGRQAGVTVGWILADVLAPPVSTPFDLVFDRGCYHGLRQNNAAGYVAALRQLTHPGSRVLILAGNANEPPPHYGPPRLKEEELRADFSRDFQFEWLREVRFDTADPGRDGALAWSILLRRKP